MVQFDNRGGSNDHYVICHSDGEEVTFCSVGIGIVSSTGQSVQVVRSISLADWEKRLDNLEFAYNDVPNSKYENKGADLVKDNLSNIYSYMELGTASFRECLSGTDSEWIVKMESEVPNPDHL